MGGSVEDRPQLQGRGGIMGDQTAIIKIDTTPRFAEVEVLEPEEPGAALRSAQGMWGQAQAFAGMMAHAVVQAQQGARFSEAELDRLWAEAFEDWLAHEQKHGGPRPAATREACAAAWADLRAFNLKHPRHMDGIDIRDWANDLRSRPISAEVAGGLIRSGRRQAGQVGLSPSTVNQYLAGISSFFAFCEHYEVRTADGRVVPLFKGLNPAKSQMVKRPRTKKLGQEVTWLDREQLTALKSKIRSAATLSDLEAGVVRSMYTLVELRDYALFTTYMMTGARNAEVRTWQWKDLIRKGPKMFFAWANKGKDGEKELPEPCWLAVRDYLRMAGRLDAMEPEDFIFRVESDSAKRLLEARGRSHANRPLSPQEVNLALRKYCRRAGIEAAAVHVHSLRHSANMLYAELGVPVERRSFLLTHSSLDMTMRYTHEMEGQRNVDWALASEALGL